MKIAIIIPAHNEEKRIGKTLQTYSAYARKMLKKGVEYELLVVINATTDGTEKVVRKERKKDARIRMLNLTRGGKGYAVIEGFKDALKRKPDAVGFVDADLATAPLEFYDLLNHLEDHGGIIASRYISGAHMSPPPSLRRVVSSRLYNLLIRALFLMPYRDTQCGAKIFTAKALKRIIPSLSMSQWAFDVDLLYHIRRAGYTICEWPTEWSDRDYSKINFLRAGPWMALGIIRLRLLHSPFTMFIRLYDSLISRPF